MDMCENAQGEKAILLGQSSTPAQQMHILQSTGAEHPWMFVKDITFPFTLGKWTYEADNLRRMP
jgi:hypothetical protein